MSDTLAQLRPRATRFFWSTMALIAFADLIVGAGFLLQLPADTPTFRAINAIVPLQIMGGLMAMASLWYFTGLLTARRSVMVIGLSLASFVNAAFALAFLGSLFFGTLLGFPSIAIWGSFALIHIFGVANMPPTSAIKELKNARFGG